MTKAFVLGNGPSLRGVDLRGFADVDTVGMNAAYREWRRVGWFPTHYCCLDDELIATHHEAIRELVLDGLVQSAFVLARILDYHPELRDDERFTFLDSCVEAIYTRPGARQDLPIIKHAAFETSEPTKITTGAYAARYAIYLGYTDLYLLGIDCSYVPVVEGARSAGGLALEMTQTPAENPNYFFDDYQQEGDRYQVPNPSVHGGNLHLQALEALRDDVADLRLPVRISNCSRISALTEAGTFPFIELDRAIRGRTLGAVAVPMTARDEEAVVANFERWSQPAELPIQPGSGGYAVPLVLVLNGRRDPGLEDRVRTEFGRYEQLSRAFSSLEFRYCELAAEDDVYESDYTKAAGRGGFKAGPNNQFFRGMELLREFGRYVFMMEADCLAVRPNWLGALEDLVDDAEPFWILGSLYRGVGPLYERWRVHINGNAIYAVGDESFQDFLSTVWRPAVEELVRDVPTLAYDCALTLYFYGGRAAPDGKEWELFQDVAHLIRLTNYIQNHAGRAETERGEGATLDELRLRSPHTYIVHGRHLFSQARAPRESPAVPRAAAATSEASAPRLLVIDSTRAGAPNATGQQKWNLLSGWPDGEFLQVWAPRPDPTPLALAPSLRDFAADMEAVADDDILAAISAFQPEVIYYRPTIDSHSKLHALALRIIQACPAPLITHIVDDWPSRLKAKDPSQGAAVDRQLRELLARSHKALSISEKMSAQFTERYGVPFEPVANGVDIGLWKDASREAAPVKASRNELVLRYCGALASDMTLDTVVNVARAVDSLQGEADVRFEVFTMNMWRQPFESAVEGLRGVAVFDPVPGSEYPRLLAEADVLVLGYNFDPESLRYIGLSMPNKLPEYLASGATVLAVGPAEANGIEYVASAGLGCCVTDPGPEAVMAAIRRLAAQQDYRADLASRAQAWAFERLDLKEVSGGFQAMLRGFAATDNEASIVGPYPREANATIDESHVVARLLEDRDETNSVMLDIGAHHGSSLAPFARRGWRIVACEPDAQNRAVLVMGHGASENVTIDQRAVSSEPDPSAAFFSSPESTGISGLHAFRDTHRQSDSVEVTTVAELCEHHDLDRIDYLKIDVEGFDWDVLKGVPWDSISPYVIECEFEDLKTASRGHTYRDVAGYLLERGYTVYLSEWHPIIRYGIRHQWRRLARYPSQLASSEGWGNILAFREDPGAPSLGAAVSALLEVEQEPRVEARQANTPRADPVPVNNGSSEPAPSAVQAESNTFHPAPGDDGQGGMSPEESSPYLRFYLWAKRRNPLLFVLGRLASWIGRKSRRYPVVTVSYLASFVGLLVAGLWVPAVLLGALGVAAIVMGFSRFLLKESHHDLEIKHLSLRRRVESVEAHARSESRERSAIQAKLKDLETEHGTRIDQLRADHSIAIDRLRAELSARHGELSAAQAEQYAKLISDAELVQIRLGDLLSGQRVTQDFVTSEKRGLRSDRRRTAVLEARIEELASSQETSAEALDREADRLERANRETAVALDARIEELASSQGTTAEALVREADRLGRANRETAAALDARIEELASSQGTTAEALVREADRLERANRESVATLEVQLQRMRSKVDAPQVGLSIDIVSALRQVNRLWASRNGTGEPDLDSGAEHGHAVLMALMVEEARRKPGLLKGKTLIEIGSTRERDPYQGSTEKLAIFTALTDMQFVSVDMDPQNTNRAQQLVGLLNPSARAVTERGETFLAECSEPLDYVYLDAFDFDHGEHSEERKARYRQVLDTEISDEACWQMHQLCAAALVTKMPEGGVVVIDDTWTDEDGKYAGKGKFAVPLLLAGGFVISARAPRSIALKRATRLPAVSAS